jgi:DNA-binding response OmpR family regulator
MERYQTFNHVLSKNSVLNGSGNTSEVSAGQMEVVIVDDDELTRRLIERLLQREFEVKVTTFGNGLEGLEYAQNYQPGLIILDLMLPGMDGFEILKKMREDDLPVKVILVSAKSRSEDIERGFDLTADEYITKPFQPKEFIVRVRKLLNS